MEQVQVDKTIPGYHWEWYKNGYKWYVDHVGTILRYFKRKVPKKKRGNLLDIGCNDGFITYMLSNMGFGCVGVDIDGKAVSFARVKDPLSYFMVNDLFNFNLEFDYVLMSEVLEHLDENLDVVVRKLHSLTREGILVTTPECQGVEKVSEDHVREYTRKELKRAFSRYFNIEMRKRGEYQLYIWGKPK